MKHEGLLDQGSLWVVIAAPTVWAAHFLIAYWMAAVWCAKFVTGDSLFWARVAIIVLTVLALATIGWLAAHAARRYHGKLVISDDLTEDSEPERTRFLGHAALLLSSLSAVAVIFDTLPALVFTTCR